MASTNTNIIGNTITSLALTLIKLLHPFLISTSTSPTLVCQDQTLKNELETYLSLFSAEDLATVTYVAGWCCNTGDRDDCDGEEYYCDDEVLEVRRGAQYMFVSVEWFEEWIEGVRIGTTHEDDVFKEDVEYKEWWVDDEEEEWWIDELEGSRVRYEQAQRTEREIKRHKEWVKSQRV